MPRLNYLLRHVWVDLAVKRREMAVVSTQHKTVRHTQHGQPRRGVKVLKPWGVKGGEGSRRPLLGGQKTP
jgi:hypothetical protein